MNSIKNSIKNCRFLWCFLLFLGLSINAASANEHKSEEGGVNITEIVFGHINDDYNWHVCTINEKHINIPLLCIVKGQNGWDVFCASKLHEGGYKSYKQSEEGQYAGKIVEVVDGKEVRPLDLSITKNVFTLFLVAAIMLVLFLGIAKKYKKDYLATPSGAQALLEPIILTVEEDITKACIGKNYKRYSPYILTVFFFILITNLIGIIPIFPGGANVTGNIAITFVLAFITFLFTNFTTNGHYWKEIFWPAVPMGLKCPIPIMQFIEFLGVFTKPIALMVRLFANMLSGHIMQLILVGLIFIMGSLFGAVTAYGVSVISILLAVFMDCLEVLVCLIQAYVFSMLSALFIGMAQERPEHEHA